MKRFLLSVFSLIIGVILFGVVIGNVGWQGIWDTIILLSGPKWVLIFLLSTAIWFVSSIRFKRILDGMGYSLPVLVLWPTYLAGFAISFLMPMLILGGELFRAYVIRDRFNIPFQKGAASVLIERLLEMTVLFVIIVFGFLFFFISVGLPSKELTYIALGAVITVASLLIFFYIRTFKNKSIVRFFSRGTGNGDILELEREVFRFFTFRNPRFWEGLMWSVIKNLFALARAWLLIMFLGKTISLLPILSILSFFYISMLIPIPAALGIHDAFQAFAFGALGVGASTGAAFALIIRAVEFLLAFIGIILVVPLSINFIKNRFLERIGKIIPK
ncbi:MAG TPA: flippase-like domain-containing protein [candidate division CPR3 bacterium]|uniref:Flippase-like domain-containing protein n=1 Tax=candidate division CPR3 bacterium TaxID=2268181 RepID=A0A7C1NPR6_UNCC3|nr:flippase-like domain-containing protein [candidate division CPR3 bacterium]